MDSLDHRAGQLRRFSRFYTRELGLLTAGLLESRFSLTEARILYEIAHSRGTTARELCTDLGLDAGYVSRILARFAAERLVVRTPSDADRRRLILSLTDKGRAEFAVLDGRSHQEARAKLGRLAEAGQQELVAALDRVETLLAGTHDAPPTPFILRPHQPGDMGWVISRHGALYAAEYGWDISFEALVAGIVAEFMSHYDPTRERCWIAERNGERAGSVFLVRQSDKVAKLRLLLVEPEARGSGLGRCLVTECLRFAGLAGYQKVTLWTNSVLHAARRIYEDAGFRLVKEENHHSFGKDLVGQNWELRLPAVVEAKKGKGSK
jgi:DNA-binding MarR family transcriptional regulator/N-acetylglutamate synthase-like GNAT family acetyltransferase